MPESIPPDAPCRLLLLRYADHSAQAYNVVGIEAADAGSRIVLREQPGFEMIGGGVQLTHYPRRQIRGGRVMYELIPDVYHVASTNP